MNDALGKAREFILTHGRLLERRLFEIGFEGAPPALAAQAVRAYRNADGGLGHGLEPDIRCPESQPIFTEIGLAALADAGCRDRELALGLCDWLAGVAGANGLVAAINDAAFRSPLAAHWQNSRPEPDLNPTAAICGLMHYQRVQHGWLSAATEECLRLALADPPREAHTLLCLLRLAEHLPDRAAAANLMDRVAWALPQARFFIAEAPVEAYGLTPLHYAPRPDSPGRALFTQRQIDGHLADLAARQQPDGGWPIHWAAPGAAAVSDWRGRWTLEAVRVLSAYGAI